MRKAALDGGLLFKSEAATRTTVPTSELLLIESGR